MKIVIGSDHAGFSYKQKLISDLEKKGFEIIDVGTNSSDSVDYPIYANKVCQYIQEKKVMYGILICGTGIGMSMAANKHKGIRAAVCSDVKSAEYTRLHNDANVLCMGERIIAYDLALEITEKFLSSNFVGGIHKNRIDMFLL